MQICSRDMEIDRILPRQQDMLSVLQEVATSKRGKYVELIIAVCWSIWFFRNLLIFEGKKENSQLSVVRAVVVVESYQRVNLPSDQTVIKQQNNNQQTWLPPRNGWCKVNVDAAIRSSNQTTGLGVMIRDSKSKVVAIVVQMVPCKGTVAYMEAEVVNLGIQVAQNIKFLPMIVESDSK